MKRIYRKYCDTGNEADDCNIETWMTDEGNVVLMQSRLTGDEHPVLAEKHVLGFIDALRRAYADRYDIMCKTARRSATKGYDHGQRDTDRYTKS